MTAVSTGVFFLIFEYFLRRVVCTSEYYCYYNDDNGDDYDGGDDDDKPVSKYGNECTVQKAGQSGFEFLQGRSILFSLQRPNLTGSETAGC